MFKKLWPALILTLGVTGFQAAHAHGDAAARHGGVVQIASDLAFELVAQPDGAFLYIEDHGKAVPAAGLGGKLIVLNGASKTEAELKPAGDKLEAKGVKVTSGSKVIGTVNTSDHKTVTVRFSVK